MSADGPTILATSGGLRPGSRTRWEFAPLLDLAVELAGVTGRAPTLCYVGTAGGDEAQWRAAFSDAAWVAGVGCTHLDLFPMRNVADPASLLGDADVVWVGGGSVANLLALWRLHGVDDALHRVWQAGVVLAGVSAGSVCWHLGGTTDSFGPELAPVTDGLGWLPWANGVHHDSEPRRRPVLHGYVADGTLPTTHATDDGAGLLYRGTTLVEAVAERRGAGAYVVRREGDRAVEEPMDIRLLPGAG